MATPHANLSILVVEDNEDLRETIIDALIAKGYHVSGVDCAEAVAEQASLAQLDLLVIDLNLPGESGLSLAQRLRMSHPDVGIIMLTGLTRTDDKAAGYAHGADIYLTKPASLAELHAAIEALSRRLKDNLSPANSDLLQLDTRGLFLSDANGQKVALTAHEADLLAAFVRAAQQKLEHWQIAEILGMPLDVINKPALELHIVRLRKKLTQPEDRAHAIKSIRGWGYQLCVPLQVR